MLVISRRVGEKFLIGDDIEVTLMDVSRDRIRIGIQADRSVVINREEVHARLKRELEEKRKELKDKRFQAGLEGDSNE